MKETINTLKAKIIEAIGNDLKYSNQVIINIMLGAYNRYQEDEKDGADYIFDINNNDDIKCCIDGGMNVEVICRLWNEYQSNHTTQYFMYGAFHKDPHMLASDGTLKVIMAGLLDNIVSYALAFPEVDGYKELYSRYVSDYMMYNDILP